MNESIFKAYDIRGNYPNDINEKVAYIIGQSYGTYLQKYCDKRKCVIGCDNRLSSPSLIAALKERTDIFGCDALNCSYNIMRTRFYDRDMLEFR